MLWLPFILILPYFILLLKIYRGLLTILPFNVTHDPLTAVSVIVACRNEQEHLPVLLDCLANQSYLKGAFEVIIVNDNSSDTTAVTAGQFKGIEKLRVIDNAGTGKKLAIRTGVNAAGGRLIITTDADCRMEKNWLRTIAAYFEKFQPDMIICPVKIEGTGNGFLSRFQELEFLSLQGVTAGSAVSGKATMCNGANLAFTKEAYNRHSGNLYDELASGDDIFLLHSLKNEESAKIIWLESNDSLITTSSSPTILSLLKQRKRWVSKGKAFKDRFTITLGIVTFVTILLQVYLLAEGIVCLSLLWIFLLVYLLKSVPDFLILLNTSARYNKQKLLLWYLPVSLIYPFYVLAVVCYSLITYKKAED
jgi:glycosyltransferase involved in cell wall biosynthesis